MLSRRATLILSIIIAMALYATLFALAPRISILRASAFPFGEMERIRVKIRADVPPEMTTVAKRQPDIITRSGSVSDLLQRTQEMLEPWDLPKPESATPEMVNEKLGQEDDLREYDFDAADRLQKTVDAKILEINRENARQDISIARQFVRPGSSRILGENEFPVLRTDRIVDDYQPRFLPRIPEDSTEENGGEASPVLGTTPPVELTAILPEEEDSPPLKVEELHARKTVQEAQNKAREESPYSFWDELLDIQLETWNPGNGEAGYFRLHIKPRSNDFEPLPKDVTFVVDASSSISPNKLLVTARGVRNALDLLRPEDYFNVVLFRDSPKFFQTQRVPAIRENIDAAKKFLENLESKGETDIYQGILPVVQEQPRPNSPGIVMVLSDGRPTIGIRDSRTLINALSSDNRLRNTIFAFGGGNTVNRQMLDLLAYRNKGDADVVGDFNAIDDQFPEYFRRLSTPLLINLTANFGGINTGEVYPKIISDFYLDKPITLLGRYDAADDSTFVVRLTGYAANDQKEVIFKAKLSEATQGNDSIAQRWAFQKAYFLIGEMSLQGETPDLLAQLRGLSQQYKIRTSYDE